MKALLQLADQLVQVAFWYCVDFMVNLASLARSSYPEANTWVLLLLLPGLLAGLIGVRVAQGLALRRARRRWQPGPAASGSWFGG